ncbi:endo alpha-1,4 polygalactosaminidase [Clostridium swellfunianum]|uniref:endo alpha-1,4 polygalactosaminidase n=1 Tax=Clostridium swellfunianum TaxID=1367462 RepID=UPI00202F7D6B|nr:endo alpha-1,4 polygalactosaminidase [Clostridium swellfunianum]MCM0647207.1 endo alpha-1,4 polygalactosaminidase [Clostridium swellfunianum]
MISRREQFKNAKDYILYYGIGKEEELSKHDIAIVEPLGQTKETLDLMHKQGTLVIAYVSAIEISKHFPMFNLLKQEDFIHVNDNPLKNEEFETYLLNIGSKRWSSMLIQHIGNLIVNENYDGIFLDTLGDIEWSVLPEGLRNDMLLSARKLLNTIRGLFEDIIIIQNNGMHQVLNYTFEFIDGLCLENPKLELSDTSDWVQASIDKLKALRKDYAIKVLLLYEENYFNESYISAVKDDVLFYKTKSYTSIE